MSDVIIIGTGLIGSMAAKHLRNNGYSVLTIDSCEPMAASKCAFGVWKTGWINKAIKPMVAEGMDILEQVCGKVQKVEFYDVKNNKTVYMNYVDPQLIIEKPDVDAKVSRVFNAFVLLEDGTSHTAKKGVFIATGAYTDALLATSGYYGTIHNTDNYYGKVLEVMPNFEDNRLYDWAPYKQSLLLQTKKRTLFGDGTSIKNVVKGDKRIAPFEERLWMHLYQMFIPLKYEGILEVGIEELEGLRPYLKPGKHDYFKQHDNHLFSATGTAKNTTVLCGYIAKQLLKAIQNV